MSWYTSVSCGSLWGLLTFLCSWQLEWCFSWTVTSPCSYCIRKYTHHGKWVLRYTACSGESRISQREATPDGVWQPIILQIFFAEHCLKMKGIATYWISHRHYTYQTRTRHGRGRCRRSVRLCWCWTRVGCKTSPSSPAAAQRSPPDGTRLSVREHSSGINHWWPLETGNEKTLWWSYLQDIVSDKNFFSRSEDTICNRKKSSLVQASEIDLWQYQMK